MTVVQYLRKSAVAASWILMLLGAGASLGAGGTYDEVDPFREERRIERFKSLGGDASAEVDVEFIFDFRDRAETRERHANIFARKLRFMGYPEAIAKPCADPSFCWLVIAPKRIRIEPAKLIALSKELDQLAADEYGRYSGWECEIFKQDDRRILALATSKMPISMLVEQMEQIAKTQCNRLRENNRSASEGSQSSLEPHLAYAARSSDFLICGCMPDRVRELQAGLSPAERDAAVDAGEFTSRYFMPKVIQPCIGSMMRQTYGEDCQQLAASLKANAEKFCPCMQSEVAQLSEAEMVQLGLESADYVPLAAQAQKEGRKPPPAPPLLKRFTEKQAACAK
jgi:hypothetical protein